MPQPIQDHDSISEAKLLLTMREAAALLNVSEKTLWNHSGERGKKIPVVRFGRTLRYSRESLSTWIRKQSGGDG